MRIVIGATFQDLGFLLQEKETDSHHSFDSFISKSMYPAPKSCHTYEDNNQRGEQQVELSPPRPGVKKHRNDRITYTSRNIFRTSDQSCRENSERLQ